MDMRAGRLRHLIELQSDQGTEQRADGSPIASWETVAKTWAEIKPLSGRALDRAMQVVGKVSHEITMRYLPSVNKKLRVRFGERIFGISAVLNTDERNIELKLLCSEAV